MTPSAIIAGVNTVRAGVGLPPVAESSALDAFATWKAQDMCTNGYWAHNSPTSTWESQLQAYPVYYLAAGENLAYGYADSASMVNGWVNSPTHYANMVNAKFDHAGIGIVQCASFQGFSNQTIVANEFTQTTPAQTQTQTVQPSRQTPAKQSNSSNTSVFSSVILPMLIGIVIIAIGIQIMRLRKRENI